MNIAVQESNTATIASTTTIDGTGEAVPRSGAERFVHIVLPAYNEANALPSLLPQIQETMDQAELPYRVIVVDDGSSDGTVEVVQHAAENMPVELVKHVVNQGLGAALRSGLEEALAGCQPQDCVVTMDADDTHPPSMIPNMLDKLDQGNNVVIASLFHDEAALVGLPWYRKILSQGAYRIFCVVFPIAGVRCYTSGYRAMDAKILQRAADHYGSQFVSERGFTCTADLLLKLRQFQLRAVEVPLALRYDRRAGESKMPVVRTIMQTFSLVIRRRLFG